MNKDQLSSYIIAASGIQVAYNCLTEIETVTGDARTAAKEKLNFEIPGGCGVAATKAALTTEINNFPAPVMTTAKKSSKKSEPVAEPVVESEVSGN